MLYAPVNANITYNTSITTRIVRYYLQRGPLEALERILPIKSQQDIEFLDVELDRSRNRITICILPLNAYFFYKIASLSC